VFYDTVMKARLAGRAVAVERKVAAGKIDKV